jgi:hypothetical protein
VELQASTQIPVLQLGNREVPTLGRSSSELASCKSLSLRRPLIARFHPSSPKTHGVADQSTPSAASVTIAAGSPVDFLR